MSDLPRQFGPYLLLKSLAKGGMGEIFLARTTGLSQFEKWYAVKKLLKKFSKDRDVGTRFVDEAKLGARLQHPNIVQVYDLGRIGDEVYMATEFVDGFDLRRVLRFCHEKKKRIPLDIALFIVREILSGLAYAHRQLDAEGRSINLIHRDISPQNVLVSFEGEVKIIDFGLAKSTQRTQQTQANVLLGNFGYMSPEQARGHKLDVRTDVYSSGVVLFELVTRTKRFVDENPLRLLEMVARPTPVMPSDRVSDVPKRIDEIYARSTAANVDDRYADADTFRQDVTEALHRLNPHASRENLAQFLNHLFLGGQAPPPPDNEALDRSVAMSIQDLYANAEAFRSSKAKDEGDRRLSHFEDGQPQTDSHDLMRSSRVGDTLTHQELTGQVLEEPTDPSRQMPPQADAAPVDAWQSPPPAVTGPVELDMTALTPLDETNDAVSLDLDLDDEPPAPPVAHEFPPGVLDEGIIDQNAVETSVYEAPVFATPPPEPPGPPTQPIESLPPPPSADPPLPTPPSGPMLKPLEEQAEMLRPPSEVPLPSPPQDGLDLDVFASNDAVDIDITEPGKKPRPSPRDGAAVITHVGKRDRPASGEQEPTMVVDVALGAHEADDVGVFGSQGSESLIIDFDSGSGSSDEMAMGGAERTKPLKRAPGAEPPSEAQETVIRPAARPGSAKKRLVKDINPNGRDGRN